MFKKLWDKFTDSLGQTIFHPQYFLKSFEQKAITAALKYANGTLIDIGCGRQPYKKYFLSKVKRYIGVDHPSVSKKYKYGERPDILADATNIPLKSGLSDINLMISVLEHLPNPEKSLRESYRLSKKGGYLILITIQNYRLHDKPYDFYRFTQYGLKELIEKAGYKILSIRPLGNYAILTFQYFNVFLLYSTKILLDKKTWDRYAGYILLPFVYILSILSNITVFALIKVFNMKNDSSFAIYNLAVAQKK